MRKGIIVGVLAVFSATLPSCNEHNPVVSSSSSESRSADVDPMIRPSDWTLDYWVGDVVEYKDLDERNIYDREDDNFSYMDSAYSSAIDANGSIDFWGIRVNYKFRFLEEDKPIVISIYVSDPSIKIYGLSMLSSGEEVTNAFEEMGFVFVEYSGFDSCFMKNNIEFRVYPTYIAAWAYFSLIIKQIWKQYFSFSPSKNLSKT